jgi:hypothetical protein
VPPSPPHKLLKTKARDMGHTDRPLRRDYIDVKRLTALTPARSSAKVEGQVRHWIGYGAMGTFVGACSTDVLFSAALRGLNLDGEQFWGRAARASRDSKESWGALYIFRFVPAAGIRRPASNAILKTLHHFQTTAVYFAAVTASALGVRAARGLVLLWASTTPIAVMFTMSSTSAPRGRT